jgi:hypothetical protein
MLIACAWRDTPAGPTLVVAGLRQFLGGWLGIGRVVVGMAARATTSSFRGTGRRAGGRRSIRRAVGTPSRRRSARPGSVSRGWRCSGRRGRACEKRKRRRRRGLLTAGLRFGDGRATGPASKPPKQQRPWDTSIAVSFAYAAQLTDHVEPSPTHAAGKPTVLGEPVCTTRASRRGVCERLGFGTGKADFRGTEYHAKAGTCRPARALDCVHAAVE